MTAETTEQRKRRLLYELLADGFHHEELTWHAPMTEEQLRESDRRTAGALPEHFARLPICEPTDDERKASAQHRDNRRLGMWSIKHEAVVRVTAERGAR